MGFPYWYIDQYYLILVVPAMLIALFAQARVSSAFNRYSRVMSSRGITGREAAQMILKQNGVTDVRFERAGGRLSDHYDPRSNTIRLSEGVDNSRSVAAIGVACHEAGHALQYAEGYSPIKLRNVIIPVTSIGSQLSVPLIMLGFFFGGDLAFLVNVGLVLFGSVAVFQLITLPVEFNASSRAIAALEQGRLLDDDELRGAQKVLSAAALTYVAALITAVANLLRLILLFGGRGSSNRKRG